MTPRERILAAMNMETPDRVPLMCQFSFGFMNQQLKGTGITPMKMWLDAENYAKGLLILRDRFQFDGILVSVHGHYHNWRDKMKILEIIDGKEVATYPNRIETYVDDDLPVGDFFNPKETDIELWFSVSLKGENPVFNKQGIPEDLENRIDDLDVLITLKYEGDHVSLQVIKDHDILAPKDMTLKLDPKTMLIARDE